MSTATSSRDRASTEAGGQDHAMTILSLLIAGIGLYGGLGWLVDRWIGTSFLMPVGMILGMAISLYIIIKRYGSGA